MKTTDTILIIDLEATCWKGEIPEGEKHEIIEIGICELNKHTGEITKNKGILVKPTQSKVSSFCTELTTITQELLDTEGVSFEEAIAILKEDYQSDQFMWASYGQYDLNMLKRQCKAQKVVYPLSNQHINVKEFFAETKGLSHKVGMNEALEILDIPLEGTHHRGVDDVKNIAKILHWCFLNDN